MTKSQIKKTAADLIARLETIREEIGTLKSEAEDYYNERSEKWQEGDNGTAYQEMIDQLQSAYDNADSAVSDLTEITEAE